MHCIFVSTMCIIQMHRVQAINFFVCSLPSKIMKKKKKRKEKALESIIEDTREI